MDAPCRHSPPLSLGVSMLHTQDPRLRSFVLHQLYESCKAAPHNCTIHRGTSHRQKKCLSLSKGHKVLPAQTPLSTRFLLHALMHGPVPRGNAVSIKRQAELQPTYRARLTTRYPARTQLYQATSIKTKETHEDVDFTGN